MRAWFLFPLLAASLLRAQDELPKRAPGESLDFEPKLMLEGPRAAAGVSDEGTSPDERVKQMQAELLQAQQRAADSEQLYKEGILAKVEVEERALRVTKATKGLADANLAVAAARADAVQKAFAAHTVSQGDLDAANAGMKTAEAADASAKADLDKGMLDAATMDLKRKRKLYAEGVGSKREVEMAEDRLALLSGTGAK